MQTEQSCETTKRVLLITVQGVGNTVLATGTFHHLGRDGYVVDAVVQDNGSEQILAGMPNLHTTYIWKSSDSWLNNVIRLYPEIRSRRYDFAYALVPNSKRESLLLFLSKASHKTLLVHKKYYVRLLHFLPFDHKIEYVKRHDVINNLRLTGEHSNVSAVSGPMIPLQESDHEAGRILFDRLKLNDKFVVSIHPGTTDVGRTWHHSNFVSLCKTLTRQQDIRILILGSTPEKALVKRISNAAGKNVIPIYGLGIREVASLISRSQFFIGNDSSLMHIASAFSLPVVVVWGYTDFRRTAPFNRKAVIIRIPYACSPCYTLGGSYIRDCRHDLKCIKDISVEQVSSITERYIGLVKKSAEMIPGDFCDDRHVASACRLDGGCVVANLRHR